MTTCHIFIAASVDGFIARSNGDIDWLENWPPVDHDYGYQKFFDSIDGLIIGRGTYEKALSFATWPYQKQVVVLSSTLQPRDLPASLSPAVRISAAQPTDIVREVGSQGWRRAYIDGGKVIQSFLRASLIEDMVVTRIPILLGSGLPLFGSLDDDKRLNHLNTTAYSSGFVQSHYKLNGTS